MANPFDVDRFARSPFVGILRGFATEQALKAAEAVVEGGITHIEVTLNTPGATEQIRLLRDMLGSRAQIGAGTIRSVQDVHVALEAGATYIVTPMVDARVISACRAAAAPALVGAFTPTEILQAWEYGAALIKVFPAHSLGPGYLRDLRGPLSDIPLMPTGGVTVENLAEFHRAGAQAFGIGGPLFDSGRIAAKDWEWLKARAGAFVRALEASATDRARESAALATLLRERIQR